MNGPYAAYIFGSYAFAAGVLGFLIVGSWLDLRRARARLDAVRQHGDTP